jgi:hypothetical protein
MGSDIFSPPPTPHSRFPTFLSGLYSPKQVPAPRRVLTVWGRSRNQLLSSGVKTAES